ncbi:MAG: FAD-dependent oxidoreductase [Alphaproteobacteria bacterium]|nr:FAD-dependent oxidoreductase [Alphaproteobacteria bacterium]
MTLSLNRRALLGGLTAVAARPTWAQSLPTDPDVVIVGAGSAGLAAARTLLDLGRTVVVVEARSRIGGRAFTDTARFGVPFDHGCSWLHSADQNPYAPLARDWGFTLRNQDGADETVRVGASDADEAELGDYGRAWDGLQNALMGAGRDGQDVAAASVSPRDRPWIEVCEAWVGPMSMGMDLEDFSCLDWYQLDDTKPNDMVAEGFGTLVRRYGEGLPVVLEAPVARIAWGGSDVRVETPKGTLAAKACIVTVSTGVLGAGSIAFDPVLPVWKQEAIADVPMGLLAKIPLQFDGARFGLAEDGWLTYHVVGREACYFLTWPFGYGLLVGFVGGGFGWELSAAGPDAAIDFARGELRKILGADVDKAFVQGDFTRWADDPYALGGYAAARPGRTSQRAKLGEPLDDRLFFAGEALAGAHAMTCGGANLSGQMVARDVARALG